MDQIQYSSTPLKKWVNDETRLNAENMNEISTAIDSINDVLNVLLDDENGIITGVNNLGSEITRIDTEVKNLIDKDNNVIDEFDQNQFDVQNDKLSIIGFQSAASGSQLVKSGDTLKWVKLDAQTVSGLATEISDLKEKVDALENRELIIDDGLIDA